MPPRTVNSRRCNVCIVEKTLAKNELHLCSGCRLVRYCSREHQRLDWELHKSFCSAIRHVTKSRQVAHIMDLEGNITTWTQLDKSLILAKCLLHTILKRELYNHELEFLTFPIHCQICFSRGNGKTHLNCEKCEAVSYCSQEHRKEDADRHTKWCLYLKYYYDFYELDNRKVVFNFESAPIINAGSMPTHLFDLIEATKQPSENKKIIEFPNNLEEYQSYLAASEYSCVVTLLYGINQCHVLNADRSVFTIFLIGARDEHIFLQKSHLTFLSSQLPTIKEFQFYLIGPEIQETSKTISFTVYTHERETGVFIHFFKETFENFAQNIHSKRIMKGKPDLIAAFNCGFNENVGTPKDTWTEGIKTLFRFDRVPIIFTSYTRMEARCDLREFSQCANRLKRKYEIVVNGDENMYKDYTPFRNMELHDHNDFVYFRNGYIHIAIVHCE